MNEEKKFAPEDMTQQKMDVSTKPIRWGPGKYNMAVPDLGHLPNCALLEFENAADLDRWTERNPTALIYQLGTRGDNFFIVYGELADEYTQEEKAVASRAADEKLQEFRRERQKREDELKAHEEEAKKEAEVCRVIGRLCIEKHGAFVTDLPKLSKLKNVRKSIADDILKAFEESLREIAVKANEQKDTEKDWDKASLKLQEILKRYVKEGA